MNINSPNLDLARIATRAFARAAPVTNRNFENSDQREYIMNNIF